MTLRNRLLIWKTQLEFIQLRRSSRRNTLPRTKMGRVHLERLEPRLALAFGAGDGSYIVEPWLGSYSGVQIQPVDQKIVAAGSMYITNPDNTTGSRMAIARYDMAGSLDGTFGSGAPSIPPQSGVSAPELGPSNEAGWDLVFQPNGKSILSGNNSVNSSSAVARFNNNGTLDSGFGSGGWTSLDVRVDSFNPAEGVALQSTGKIVVAGTSMASSLFTPFNSQAEVARFTASGALDNGGGGFGKQKSGYTLSTFGMPKNVFHDVAVQPDDKLVAVGLAYTDGPYRRLITARYTASGTLDTTFNGSGYSVFLPQGISDSFGSAVALQTNGKIVVSGFSTGTDGAPDMLVVRYNSNGTLDTSFGGSGYVRLDDSAATQSQEYGNDVVIQSDGKIVVGGWTSVAGNPSNILVARFNVDGTRDSTFAAGGYKIGAPVPSSDYHSFEGQGVALQTDGSIIVAGSDRSGMTSSSAVFHPLVMRFSGTNSALAPTVSRSTNSAAAATDTAIALLEQEDLTSTNLKKNSSNTVQIGTTANTSSLGSNGTPTVAALTTVASLVQKSNSSKSGLGKISSPDLVLSLDDWFGSLGQ